MKSTGPVRLQRSQYGAEQTLTLAWTSLEQLGAGGGGDGTTDTAGDCNQPHPGGMVLSVQILYKRERATCSVDLRCLAAASSAAIL